MPLPSANFTSSVPGISAVVTRTWAGLWCGAADAPLAHSSAPTVIASALRVMLEVVVGMPRASRGRAAALRHPGVGPYRPLREVAVRHDAAREGERDDAVTLLLLRELLDVERVEQRAQVGLD